MKGGLRLGGSGFFGVLGFECVLGLGIGGCLGLSVYGVVPRAEVLGFT